MPLVPKTCDRGRRTVPAGEVVRLLTARCVLPFVIARYRDQATIAIECIAEHGFGRDRLCARVEGRHLHGFQTLLPPPRKRAPTHWYTRASSSLRQHNIDWIGRTYVVARLRVASG